MHKHLKTFGFFEKKDIREVVLATKLLEAFFEVFMYYIAYNFY